MTPDKGVVERLRAAADRVAISTSEGHAPSYDNGLMAQYRLDEAAARIETLERALRQIIRMKTVPNDGINTFTLAAVHHVAESALSPSTNGAEK